MDKSVVPTPGQSGISRRQLLRYFALGCAGLLSSNALAGTLSVERVQGGPVRKGQILSDSQMALLRELVEVIIPQTDTPGAADTDTHGFIDDQLAHCQAPDEAQQFIAELDRFGALVQKHWGNEFQNLSSSDMHEAMSSLASGKSPFGALTETFFYKLKSLTILGYYSSQAGASQELVYLPVPGGYLGNFKVSENGGRAYSPLVF